MALTLPCICAVTCSHWLFCSFALSHLDTAILPTYSRFCLLVQIRVHSHRLCISRGESSSWKRIVSVHIGGLSQSTMWSLVDRFNFGPQQDGRRKSCARKSAGRHVSRGSGRAFLSRNLGRSRSETEFHVKLSSRVQHGIDNACVASG